MFWLFRGLFSAVFLLSIVLSVPIAFDVGGRDAGLAYSLSLFLFYFVYSSIKLATPPESRVRWTLVNLLRLTQWILIPTLLIWALNRFSVDSGASDWVARTFNHLTKSQEPSTWYEWLFGSGGVLESATLGGWDKTLRYSSPVFQLLEGFCSLLVIQAAGQITRWLVNRGRSDTWVVRDPFFSSLYIQSNKVLTDSDRSPRVLRVDNSKRRLLPLESSTLPAD
jgi:hypothetical protein